MLKSTDFTENELDFFLERAAIMEFDAGFSRYEAERRAYAEVEAIRKLFKEKR